MAWPTLSKVDSCNGKSVYSGELGQEHDSCYIIALNNRPTYVNLADNEGDPGPSKYKPPKKTQLLKSFVDGKGSPWKPPPPPPRGRCSGSTNNLGWGVDVGGYGDGGGSKIKPGKCGL